MEDKIDNDFECITKSKVGQNEFEEEINSSFFLYLKNSHIIKNRKFSKCYFAKIRKLIKEITLDKELMEVKDGGILRRK